MKSFARVLFFITLLNSIPANCTTHFYNLGNKEGLSLNAVRDITQDESGFIWIATLKGLNRFDGFTVKQFLKGDAYGLISDCVEFLIPIGDDLLVGTDKGVCRFNSTSETFTDVLNPDGEHIGRVHSASSGNPKSRFFASESTLYSYENGALKPIVENRHYTDLFFDENSILWGARPDGIDMITPDGTMLKGIDIKDVFGIDDIITSISLDPYGYLWVGTHSSGVFRYKESDGQSMPIEASEADAMRYVRCLYWDDGGLMWIGTENGLFSYNVSSRECIHYKHDMYSPEKSISDNAIYSVYKSKEGHVWIGSYFGGVDYMASSSERFSYIIPDGGIHSLWGRASSDILESSDGKIWFGSEDNGISVLNPYTNTFSYLNTSTTPRLLGNNVHALEEDSEGNVWVGTFVNGLQKISRGIHSVSVVPTEDKSIYKLKMISEDKMFIGFNTGAGIMDLSSYDIKYILKSDDESARVDDVAMDNNGNLWMCLHFSGIACYDTKRDTTVIYNIANCPQLKSDFVYCAVNGSDDAIWFGTASGGLSKFRDGRFETFDNNGEFEHIYIYSILEDSIGRLWISTDNGIYTFNEETCEFEHYYARNDLISNQFNLASGCKLKNGDMYFGSIYGVCSFSPNLIKKNETFFNNPKIYFSNIKVQNRKIVPYDNSGILGSVIDKSSSVTLKHPHNNVSLGVTPILLCAQERQYYTLSYKLSNIDKDFVEVPLAPATLNYTNLRGGTYDLCVRVCDRHHIVVNEKHLQVKVLPHMLLRWWMFAVYSILVFGSTYYFISSYRRNQKNRLEINLYEQRLNFFTYISHEFKTPLSIIMSLLYKSSGNGSDSLSAKDKTIVTNNIKQLQYLIKQLSDFRSIESGFNGIKCSHFNVIKVLRESFEIFQPAFDMKNIHAIFSSNQDECIAYSDKDKIEKLFGNLISNAVKHTEYSGVVKMNLTIQDGRLKGEVFNTGSFIPEEQYKKILQPFFRASSESSGSSGIGLAMVSEILQLLDGELEINSQEHIGTSFIATIPIKCESPEYDNGKQLILDNHPSAAQEIVDNVYYGLSSDSRLPLDKSTDRRSKYTIILVEDNIDFNNLIFNNLSPDYSIIQAYDGDEATKMLTPDIDMLISDVHIPGRNGIELCRYVKQHKELAHIPVILMTSETSEDVKINGLQLGADAYIVKPFLIKELALLVGNLFKNKELIQSHFSDIVQWKKASMLSNKDEVFLKDITSFVKSKLNDQALTVDSIAKHAKISRTSLYNHMTSVYGVTPNDFITQVRLSVAEEKIFTTNLRLSEIAWQCGFSSASYFSKVFKSYYGKTPSEFKKDSAQSE
ncbi:MAG: helix-turn-helix domain-containing protein [Bacteroidaceae bacterium]|nr:helix-turn-helix domain-containing protein [Bacteroidaceae bacterium]